MSKFTKGPWSTGTDDEDAHIVYDDKLGFVADAGRDDGDAETEAANAKLMAASPDLLAACKRALTFHQMGQLLGEENKAASLLDTLDKLRAAIAKAE